MELRDDATKTIVDQVEVMASVRSVTTEGLELRLNGKPLAIRGVLNWGYAPPRIAPSIDPNWMREEIMAAKQMGFNLMKFCLWVPPRPYLDLCDELGMLAWVEYPTWHPKFTPEFLPDLRREYQEFFEFDRNHPSVVLRSLTCETGHSADLKVIQELYDACHAAIPGSIVEDDSSWISWNRVHDFYDDHPYGNNHTWEGTLAGLDRYIQEHGEKPLVLGEAIAADTWFDPSTRPSLLQMPNPKRSMAFDRLPTSRLSQTNSGMVWRVGGAEYRERCAPQCHGHAQVSGRTVSRAATKPRVYDQRDSRFPFGQHGLDWLRW